MPDDQTTQESGELQFDRVVTGSPAETLAETPAVVCAGCHRSIETEYYDVNGHTCCGACRTALESWGDTPQGIAPLVKAGLFGLGAGIVGAIIYYGVIAIANLEIGIVAILIGYMVGYSVRKGAGGRGGLRFQILAVALTYLSIALAYAPIAIKQTVEGRRNDRQGATATNAAVPDTAPPPPTATGVVVAFALLFAVILALPVAVVLGSLPSGLLSALIMFIGMRQAWTMTGAPVVHVLGPYRVGAAPASKLA